ncbi:hypothetical protein [Ramlibacter montanisoli]|uniref:hypothetical protein n=1 Tax=Ramlibacter montanisoli TaxID=2732512 RepID=UPI001C0F01DF|nr:hypothetical protein [Ramlibacter montanisoli]
MISRAGPKPNSSVAQPLPCWIGTALISTSLAIRKLSRSRSKKAGSSVVKVLAVRDAGRCCARAAGGCLASSADGQVTGALKRPSMLVLRL